MTATRFARHRPDGTPVELWFGWYRPDPGRPWRVWSAGSSAEAVGDAIALLAWPGEWTVLVAGTRPVGEVDMTIAGGGYAE